MIRNRFGLLRISLTAMKNTGFTGFLPSLMIPFFLYLSPVVPLRIASTGVNFFTLRVLRKQNSTMIPTTAAAQRILRITAPELSITML